MYFNTLIIMNEETPGYGRRSRGPSGYCKLTMPNRIICYVQGLKQLPQGQSYRLHLMSEKKQQSVEVGAFPVGMGGNKETRWIMNPEDIDHSGLTAKDIDGALISVEGENLRELGVPLVGFASEPYIWKNLVEVIKEEPKKEPMAKRPEEDMKPGKEVARPATQESQLEKKEAEPVQEESQLKKEETDLATQGQPAEKTDVDEEESLVDQVKKAADEKEMKALEEVKRLKEIIKKLNATIEELQEKLKVREAVSDLKDSEADKSQPGKMPSVKEELEAFVRKFQIGHNKKQKASMDVIKKMFTERIPMNPFPYAEPGMKWVRITHEDLKEFAQLSPEWINQPFIVNAHKQYKHFILGKDESDLVYYLGIPDVFYPEKNEILNIDHIERFSCRQDTSPKAGEVGYWLALL